ncbi:hypothetical protein ACSFB8_11560 [Enterococcus faecalis]
MKNRQQNSFIEEMEDKLSAILLATGSVNRKYIVRDVVFATDRVEVDLFSSEVNPNDVFKKIYLQLKQIAYEYEADAVINCHFEQKSEEVAGVKVVELFAYGTVVQFTQTTIG